MLFFNWWLIVTFSWICLCCRYWREICWCIAM